jgi:hypothetical protein
MATIRPSGLVRPFGISQAAAAQTRQRMAR